jgi:DNA topoisomerase-1
VKKGTQSRSLATEEDLFTVSLEQALELFAQPKTRGRRGAAAPPLRELGPDRDSGKPIVVKEGRFGPYVTDGEVNASLRKGDSVEEIDLERAAELLADRRARAEAAAPKAPRARKSGSAGRGRANSGPRR